MVNIFAGQRASKLPVSGIKVRGLTRNPIYWVRGYVLVNLRFRSPAICIFFWPQNLTPISFAALWPAKMNSTYFEISNLFVNILCTQWPGHYMPPQNTSWLFSILGWTHLYPKIHSEISMSLRFLMTLKKKIDNLQIRKSRLNSVLEFLES